MGFKDWFEGVFFKSEPFTLDQVKELIALEMKFKGLKVSLEKGDPRHAKYAIISYKVMVEEKGKEEIKTIVLGKASSKSFERTVPKIIETILSPQMLERINKKIIPAVKEICNPKKSER